MKILRNIIAIILGGYIGGKVNMDIIVNSDAIISLPEGIIPGDMESLAANMHLFEPINYLMPFLAHAIGTLVGAFLAASLAASNKLMFAFVIGGLFLLGGIMMVFMVPSPMWFNVTDIALAYIPMGWLGWKLAVTINPN